MINPNLYSPFSNNKKENTEVIDNTNKKELSNTFFAKVFLYFGVELLLTSLLTIGFAFLFDAFFPSNSEKGDIFYLVSTLISLIGMVVTLIIVQSKTLKKEKGGYIATFIHCLFMSILLADIGYYIGSKEIMGISVAVTSILFLIMCVFGYLIKNKNGWLIGLLIGFGVSSFILLMINMFLFPFIFINNELLETYQQIYLITNFFLLIYSCIVTIIDVVRIKKMASNGLVSNPLALYYSLLLYQDYVIILLYVFYIFLAKSKK